jgi:protein-S-isoprenylcysteine O-methyltransferase Ste14
VVGVLLDGWLGAVLGVVMYLGSRLFAPAEEAALADEFGGEWDSYCHRIKIRWL